MMGLDRCRQGPGTGLASAPVIIGHRSWEDLMAVINGDNNANILNGTSAADDINGLGGDDTINAGRRPTAPGSDTDTVNGGTGNDTWNADLSGLFVNVTFTLGTTTSIAAAGLTSILNLERIGLSTGSGNDIVTGGARDDTISTGDGND